MIKIRNKTQLIRRLLLKFVFKVIGFESIQGHWVYSKSLNAKSIIIDLGANKGSFSKVLFKKYGAKCYLIEPNKALLSEVNCPSFIKLNYALSNKSGFIDFHFSNNDEASSIIPSISNSWGKMYTEQVKSVRWEELIITLELQDKIIDVLKIDIEGAELDLIESFTDSNISNVRQITVEFHDWLDASLEERTKQSINKLTRLGFNAFTDAPSHSWPIEMVFLRSNFLKNKSALKRIGLFAYNKVRFLKY